jgi:preprotein translocase subunit SecG
MVIASMLMCLIVLIQNSKGGGLASGFASSNQIMGVKKTTDFIEKATWSLAIFMVVISIVATWALPQTTVVEESVLQQNAVENSMVNPNTVPDFSEQSAPAETATESAPAAPAQGE